MVYVLSPLIEKIWTKSIGDRHTYNVNTIKHVFISVLCTRTRPKINLNIV